MPFSLAGNIPIQAIISNAQPVSDTAPSVSRRVQTPNDLTLRQLHRVMIVEPTESEDQAELDRCRKSQTKTDVLLAAQR
jgi:hypothetical protein